MRGQDFAGELGIGIIPEGSNNRLSGYLLMLCFTTLKLSKAHCSPRGLQLYLKYSVAPSTARAPFLGNIDILNRSDGHVIVTAKQFVCGGQPNGN